MNPFVPLWIAGSVWLFILWFENTDNLAVWVPCKVAAGAPLRNHARMDFLANSSAYAIDNGFELGTGHDAGLRLSQSLGGNGPHALERLKNGMVNLEAVLLAEAAARPAAALEAGSNLVGPALKPGVDGLDVDAARGADAAAEFRPRRHVAGPMARRLLPRDRSETRRRQWCLVVGYITLVGLSEALVPRRGARHDALGMEKSSLEAQPVAKMIVWLGCVGEKGVT